jgi:WD40 repeat protein
LETNAGKFNDVAASPINNCVVTAGADGFVRLWDYGNKRQFCARNFKTQSEATCIEWVPYNKRNSGRLLAVGFSDGIIRLVVINQNELTLIKADKVLKRKIILMKCSPDGATLSAMDDGGDLFFLSLNPLDLQDMKPYCLH